MEFKDYYATLGVAKNASDKEIKQAFRKLARKYHPDVNPGDKAAEARFKEINEANEVLGDPEKRKKYDELGANWRHVRAGAAGRRQARRGRRPVRRPVDVAPGGGGFRPMTEEEVADMFGGRREPVLRFLPHVFRRRRPGEADAARRAGRSRARPARAATSSTRSSSTSRTRCKARVQRLGIQHDGQQRNVEVRIPAGVTDGSRVRVSRRRRARHRAAAPQRRSVSAGPAAAAARSSAKGRDLYTQGARAGDHGGARRRSRRADAGGQVAAAEDSAGRRRTARSSACAGTACRRRRSTTTAAISTPRSMCSCRRR